MALTAEQQAIRSQGIGSSEIAAVAGLDPYAGPMDVYLRKRGLIEHAETEAMARGRWLEPVLARWFEEEHEVTLVPGATVRDERRPWMLATPDYLVQGEIVECKTAGLRQAHRWGEPGTDEVPESYLAQVQWQMAVVGAARASVVVLLATEYLPRVYVVRADREIQDGLAELGGRFWHRHVEAGVPPTPDASEATKAWLRATYPHHVAALRPPTHGEIDLVTAYRAARRSREASERLEEEIKAKLCASIGEAEGIAGEWGRITWKSAKGSRRTDWEALARFLGATEQQIAQHTTETAGSRRFLARWAAEEE